MGLQPLSKAQTRLLEAMTSFLLSTAGRPQSLPPLGTHTGADFQTDPTSASQCQKIRAPLPPAPNPQDERGWTSAGSVRYCTRAEGLLYFNMFLFLFSLFWEAGGTGSHYAIEAGLELTM